jgi:CBS domain-containing protein
MRVHQIMTPHVITIGANAPIVQAIDTMLRHHISGLPVVDAAGRLIGIVSQGDFIRRAETGTDHKRARWLSFLAGSDRAAAEFVREHGRKVGEIMTPNPITVTEDTPLDEVAQTMECKNVKRLPVMRGDRLVGIITRSDFLTAVANFSGGVPAPSVDDDHIRSEIMAALRQAAIVAAENVAGVKSVQDHLITAPASEEDFGGGDFVSLQEQPSTADDEPL